VKSAHANAYNLVSPERCSVHWILKKRKCKAAIFSVILMRQELNMWVVPIRLVKLIIKLVAGLLLCIPCLIFTRKKKLKGLTLIWDSVGGQLGFIGYQPKTYTG
jgi:hypothetical protein